MTTERRFKIATMDCAVEEREIRAAEAHGGDDHGGDGGSIAR